MKKILLAILIAVTTLLIVPVVIQTNETGYIVEAATVKISKTKYTMNKGETSTLKIKGTKKKVKWYTSNKKIATVNSNGKVTAKSKGTATITAKIGSKKYKCKITVENVSINKTKLNIELDNNYTLKVKGSKRTVKWSTSNKKIVTVNSNGKVTAKSKGTATITAKVGNKKLKCKVTIKVPDYKKKIGVSYKKLSNKSILVSIKNKAKRKLDYVEVKVKFYKNNKLVHTDIVNTACLLSGKTAYIKLSNYDASNIRINYDKIKLSVTDAIFYSGSNVYKDLSKNVSVKTSKKSNKVVCKITNKKSSNIDWIDIGVIYYKKDKIVDYSSGELFLKSKKSKEISIKGPYDSNKKSMKFDKYKVILNYVCSD
ncbi:MAG: Ig domain-containing protein [Clostridia bacterium]|nr:Ig domain-containing protein [Clostridia bacterium]